ncbi:ras-domain-containing protein [Rickenella mellea]|uniref:Ras-domain-containing protein n=1 Tax=Rickenella mellea TaxID=50990 RepID=A0A4Y7Q1P2_9AGAM|nr:ras-domain-containing protein [Rickenella mellea]
MRTIKLVIIGDSGVGKTSIREQYITGRFSTGYRATIGTDFITKTLPHHTNPDDSVTLQIWDTAGQERFSSLSAAFFRGADAALLMFDVNQRETLHNLTKWWNEFKKRAPVPDEDAREFCVVVVGNKVDVLSDQEDGEEGLRREGADGESGRVAESEALEFLDEMIPPASPYDSPVVLGEDPFVGNGAPRMNGDLTGGEVAVVVPPPPPLAATSSSTSSSSRTRSIAINANTNGASSSSNGAHPFAPYHPHHHSHHHTRGSKSASSERGGSMVLGGTMTTTHTSMTVYHTPSSSLFDTYTSASSSPMSPSLSPPGPNPNAGSGSGVGAGVGDGRSDAVKRRRMTSASTSTGSSTPTITPSLFARRQGSPTPPTPTNLQHPSSPSHSHSPSQAQYQSPSQPEYEYESPSQSQPRLPLPLPPPPETGPALFLTSAKTGSGVAHVFEYVAARVVGRWEYEEALETRTMHVRDGTMDTIRLREGQGVGKRLKGSCCGT